jgi:hypothetical protein
MPTFQRLREKHPDAEMKWFARGKLWASPEAARPPRPEHRDHSGGWSRERNARGDRDRRDRPAARPEREPRNEARNRDWRPGGEHRDPRQQFKDAKKARNQRWREEKFERKQRFGDNPPKFGAPPSGERGRSAGPPRKDWNARPPREKPHGDKFAPRGDRSRHPQPQQRSGPPRWSTEEARRGPSQRRPAETRPAEARRPKPQRDDLRKPQRDDRRKPEQGDWKRPEQGDWRKSLPRDSWRDAPREKPHGDKLRAASAERPFKGRERFERREQRPADGRRAILRNQGTDEPAAPPRPRGPNREPKPSDNPAPSAPPRPNEPEIPPPGPPERGRLRKNK